MFTVRIEDGNGGFIYGTTESDAIYPTMKTTYNHTTRQWFLTGSPDSSADIPIDTNSGSVTLRLDTRAGIDAPQSVADLRMDLDESDPEVLAFFEAIESLG